MTDPTPTDWRALCFDLAEALCGYEVTSEDGALIERARAAIHAVADWLEQQSNAAIYWCHLLREEVM
jgi:hypothetical protein